MVKEPCIVHGPWTSCIPSKNLYSLRLENYTSWLSVIGRGWYQSFYWFRALNCWKKTIDCPFPSDAILWWVIFASVSLHHVETKILSGHHQLNPLEAVICFPRIDIRSNYCWSSIWLITVLHPSALGSLSDPFNLGSIKTRWSYSWLPILCTCRSARVTSRSRPSLTWYAGNWRTAWATNELSKRTVFPKFSCQTAWRRHMFGLTSICPTINPTKYEILVDVL